MAIPLVPWECHVFPNAIQAELRRRITNRGLKPIDSFNTFWDHNNDDWGGWASYKGPMTSWTRVCSNGVGLESRVPLMEGFVLYGGKDFYTSYGFNQGIVTGPEGSVPNRTIIGYTPDGTPHVIDNDLANSQYPIHVPNPEIEKISAEIQKELLRRVRIEWTCFSFKQLEYMTPYFLVPGITVTVEWGWNHFNPLSLLDLADTKQLAIYYNNPYPLYTENILNSKGNYEVVFGKITNFEWSIDGNKIKCVTEVTSKDRLWAGLVITSNITENPKNENDIKVIDSLRGFVKKYLDEFKTLLNQKKTADELISSASDQLKAFLQYVKDNHKNNYEEYIFGLFFGRDENTVVKKKRQFSSAGGNKKDFDRNSPRQDRNFWINMGLIVEMINFFSSQYKGVDNKSLFRVDVDDCVISGHPNLISANGDILLIPNAIAPKYFSGVFGNESSGKGSEYQDAMIPCTKLYGVPDKPDPNKDEGISLKWANYRLRQICKNFRGIQRDNISSIINYNRNHFSRVEFPFIENYTMDDGGQNRTYSAFYTGFFKNLYLNSQYFKNVVSDSNVITFMDIYEEIFRGINSAASDFWKLSLVGSTGRKSTIGLATMKVVDGNLSQYTSNGDNEIFTFDYNSADGLLQSMTFRPMLSNAQAIRTIYAQTNSGKEKQVALSDNNSLLEYKFRDRLDLIGDKSENESDQGIFKNNTFPSTMAKAQALSPPDKAFQMTVKDLEGKEVIYRLAIPPEYSEILTLLLDDGDKDYNPRYVGIMPGIQAEFTIQGIAGIRTFSVFRVRGLPEPYSEENIVFLTRNVTDTIQGGQWTTTIIAGVIPLRGYFRNKLGLPVKAVPRGE